MIGRKYSRLISTLKFIVSCPPAGVLIQHAGCSSRLTLGMTAARISILTSFLPSTLLFGLGNEKKMVHQYLSLSRLPNRARIERFGHHVPGKRSCSRMSNTQECLARKRGGQEPTWNRKSGFGFSSDHLHVAWTCSLTWCDISSPGSLFRLRSEPQNGFPAVRDPFILALLF